MRAHFLSFLQPLPARSALLENMRAIHLQLPASRAMQMPARLLRAQPVSVTEDSLAMASPGVLCAWKENTESLPTCYMISWRIFHLTWCQEQRIGIAFETTFPILVGYALGEQALP